MSLKVSKSCVCNTLTYFFLTMHFYHCLKYGGLLLLTLIGGREFHALLLTEGVSSTMKYHDEIILYDDHSLQLALCHMAK